MKARQNNLEKAVSVTDQKKCLNEVITRTIEKPSPMDFEAFLPWVCMSWETPMTVRITKVYQEEFSPKAESRRGSSKSAKSVKIKPDDENETIKKSVKSTTTSKGSPNTYASGSEDVNSVPIKAHYDGRDHLVEISIIGCPVTIHRKIIQALSLCTNFHYLLSKLTIRKGGLTAIILYEIAKLLPHSNLTDICMDDSRVPEENYYVLLDQITQLKTLSLNRCRLSDVACADLAAKLDFGCSGSSLLTLDMGSNLITDVGAQAIGNALRRNRHLLHLGLSGNTITDAGALCILKHLMEFPLNYEDILDTRRRKIKYIEDSMALYDKCLEELQQRQRIELEVGSSSGKKSLLNSRSKSIKKLRCPTPLVASEASNHTLAENMVKEIIGEFADPFGPGNVVVRDDYYYGVGNMILCSLNLAYNNLGYLSVKKLGEVIRYQVHINKPAGASGLMRVVLEGNYVPQSCFDYERIDMLLRDLTIQYSTTFSSLSLHTKKKRSMIQKKLFNTPTDE